MKLWIEDYSSSDRRTRSEEEAEKEGFLRASSVQDADILAFHEGDLEYDSVPLSKNSTYEDKVFIVYTGGKEGLISVDGGLKRFQNREDVDSERVLYLAFAVDRSSYISSLSWRRIADLIDNGGKLSWRHFELYPLTLNHLSTLSILCQGYLAAYGGNGLESWKHLSEELRSRVVSPENQDKVSKSRWWLKVLSSSDDWKIKLRQEADEQARLRSIPGEAKKVKRLIEALEDGRTLSLELVEATYQATRKLLGEA